MDLHPKNAATLWCCVTNMDQSLRNVSDKMLNLCQKEQNGRKKSINVCFCNIMHHKTELDIFGLDRF